MRRRGGTSINADMTSLIDVVFLLIVFFVLVSRIVDEDRPPLDLPSPTPAATRVPEAGLRTVVSVLGGAGDVRLRLDGVEWSGPAASESLRVSLGTLLAKHPTASVQIRAGRDTPWVDVAPVLDAARGAGRDARLPGPVHVQLAAMRSRGQ